MSNEKLKKPEKSNQVNVIKEAETNSKRFKIRTNKPRGWITD